MTDMDSRFLNREEASDWDIVANHYFGINNITNEQKELVRKALLFLKTELGVNYLMEIDKNHPMDFHINNYVLESRLWFVDLASDIQSVKKYFSYNELYKRLKNPSLFPEAFSVLEIAIKLCKAGFNVEFDPIVIVNDRPKKPDLRVINSSKEESFYCEVSVLNISDVEMNAGKTGLFLFDSIIRLPSLEYSGKVKRTLQDYEIKEISNKIIELKKKIIKESGFGELIIDNVICLALATEENKDKLLNWAREHNCEFGNFEPPYFVSDELQRIKNKIAAKQWQLPFDRQNLIMIYSAEFFFRCGNPLHIINELEKFLLKYKNVSGVIIRGKVTTIMSDLIAQIKQHVYIQKMQYNKYVEQYLILWNQHSNVLMTVEQTKKIIDSIVLY